MLAALPELAIVGITLTGLLLIILRLRPQPTE